MKNPKGQWGAYCYTGCTSFANSRCGKCKRPVAPGPFSAPSASRLHGFGCGRSSLFGGTLLRDRVTTAAMAAALTASCPAIVIAEDVAMGLAAAFAERMNQPAKE